MTYGESESRAGQFLEARGSVLDLSHLLRGELVKVTSMHAVIYASQLDKAQAKTITESKVIAEASDIYIKARENVENIENDMAYLKGMYDLFHDAHLLYRQMSKRGEGI